MRDLDRGRFEPLLMGPQGPMLDWAASAGIRTISHVFARRYESIKIMGSEVPFNPYPLTFRAADACRIARLIRRERIDLVHTNNLDAHLTGWFLNRLFGVPVVWHIRIHWPRHLYRIPWPDAIIFVSRALLEASVSPRRRSDSRVHVVYNGIDPGWGAVGNTLRAAVRAELGVPDTQQVLGTVGRLQPVKRHDMFIRVIAALRDMGVPARGVLVGSEVENRTGVAYTQQLRELVSALGLEDRIVFVGERRDVERLMGAFDVFLFCSDRDSNPRTVLEAMAAGRPIVATRSGGVPEMLEHERCGLLVDRGDVQAAAIATRRLLEDRRLATTLGGAAANLAASRFTIQQHVREVEQVYEGLLGHPRAAR